MLDTIYEVLDHDLDKKVRATSPTVGILAMVGITLAFGAAITIIAAGFYP